MKSCHRKVIPGHGFHSARRDKVGSIVARNGARNNSRNGRIQIKICFDVATGRVRKMHIRCRYYALSPEQIAEQGPTAAAAHRAHHFAALKLFVAIDVETIELL